MKDELKTLVGNNEKILYEGKPNKKVYIYEAIFNPMLFFAILWAVIDISVIATAFTQDATHGYGAFMVIFFCFHLMPVWIYLIGILTVFIRYKNTYYIVTDRAIYVSTGVLRKTFNTKSFAELSHINLHRGFFDQMFGAGDIIATSSQMMGVGYDNNNQSAVYSASIALYNVTDYERVYKIVKEIQEDVYTDVMYPNDKRPENNHGYKTKRVPRE